MLLVFIANLLIAELTLQSLKTKFFYCNTGCLLITSAYFIASAFTKKEFLLDSNQPRNLWIGPQTKKFDFKMIVLLILAAIMQISINFAIALNLKLEMQAVLEIRIVQAICSINFFFQATLNLFLNKSKIYVFTGLLWFCLFFVFFLSAFPTFSTMF